MVVLNLGEKDAIRFVYAEKIACACRDSVNVIRCVLEGNKDVVILVGAQQRPIIDVPSFSIFNF